MEMTESFRQPTLELSKSDFFNFVTSNEITDAQYKEQMRSVNVFMESPDSRSNPLLSEEPKEQNNNVLLSGAGGGAMASATTALESFDSIWNADRERGRLEEAMLEDLNYWSHEGELAPAPAPAPALGAKLGADNTDGHIYTLTVQEVSEQAAGAGRYWCKEEDVSMSSPHDLEHMQQSSLDLESILNIMPHQINGFGGDFGQDALGAALPKVEPFNYDDAETDGRERSASAAAAAAAAPAVVKIEPYGYEESEFATADSGEMHSPIAMTSPLLERQIEYNNNNNDWKLTDQNGESDDSLLRNALQGKAVIRYSAIHKSSKIDSSGEIRRVVINNNKADVPSMYSKENQDQIVMTLNSMPTNGVSVVVYEDGSLGGAGALGSPPADTSSARVDDLLLSTLDASYPDDYEKLKRITSELGESIQQYCAVESGVYSVQQLGGELVGVLPDGQLSAAHLQLVSAPAVSSSKCAGAAKKYRRVGKSASPALGGGAGGVQPATSTSNGIRKERSLHYCSICAKGFKDKYSVNVHVRTHTGEKPFSCSLCGKSFRQKAHLAKHYQTHIAQKTATGGGGGGGVKPAKQR